MVTRETTTTMQDPYNASYGVEDPEFAITQLAQTTMRSELGKISLGEPFFTYLLCSVQVAQSHTQYVLHLHQPIVFFVNCQ